MFKLIAGPCVIESEELCMSVATHMKKIADRLGLDYYFKASYDKANRTSASSVRGPGLHEGVRILEKVKRDIGVKILTDVHDVRQMNWVAESTIDVVQIPALLSRQTDLIQAAAKSGKIVNIKKGQFMSPVDALMAVTKINPKEPGMVWLTERGTTFGYNNLVVDMRSLESMKSEMIPIIFDATHSVQHPGGHGSRSSGDRRFVEPLARAAVAVGVDGLFFETHPSPDIALCDGPNMVPLDKMEPMLERLMKIHEAAND